MLYSLRLKSCSRANFSVNLVREIFSKEERQESNVKGKRGKKKLSEGKMSIVQEKSFQIYPLANGEDYYKSWRLCERAIDESNRRLNRRLDVNNL